MKKLHLGCGAEYKKGWVNVDIDKNVKTDKIVDLEKFPYPFKNNEFDVVYIKHVLENLDNSVSTI